MPEARTQQLERLVREQAAANADVMGQRQLWVLNAAPNEVMFTDDGGNGRRLAYAGRAFQDGFSDFVANKHVHHAAVSLTVAGRRSIRSGLLTTNSP